MGNKNNAEIVAYCWTSIPGFSDVGSFTGTGTTDGPFVYTGFTPRLILIRVAATGATGEQSWFCYDTAREQNNPANEGLEWNNQTSEGAQARDIDILSNGFKIRSAANQTNHPNATFIYAAWAEMPFGGEDTAPATAR